MVQKTDLSKFNCSLAKALANIGDWWTLLIVRDAFFGASRFSEFQQSLGVARNILTTRLQGLVDAGIFERRGSPARPRYVLTKKGTALLPALLALMQWGDEWESANRPPMLVTDDKGEAAQAIVATTRSGKPLNAQNTRFAPGPGANKRTRSYLTMRAAAKDDSHRS
jgi:DNA-binding HxlR family transcriptional regulator